MGSNIRRGITMTLVTVAMIGVPLSAHAGGVNGTSRGPIDANDKGRRPGGAPVYVASAFKWYRETGGTFSYPAIRTRNNSRSEYIYERWNYPLQGDSNKVRADNTRVCQNEKLQPDPCSDARAYPTFSY
jgi:hypothetical protein